MESALPQPSSRTSLNGSALVELLCQLALVDRPGAPAPLVQGLAQWLGWKESIPLAAALQGNRRPAAAPVLAGSSTERLYDRLYNHVHHTLGRAIADESATAREDGASFVPFRQRYFSLQQTMDGAINPLRTQLRAALAQHPAAPLRQLAALDAVMAQALAPREQALLALMPVLLEKHFSHLRQAATVPSAAPWLPTFRRHMQQLLAAELDLRLQPAQGLLHTLLAPPAQTHLS